MSWLRHNAKRRFGHIRPYIIGSTLQDIGAGEGMIGELIARELKMKVDLLDVVDLNQTNLPHITYDGRHIPFPDDSRDTITLLLTLHHCQDPERVLAEAARVAKKRIIVTESVYHTRPGRCLLTWLDSGFNGLRSRRKMPCALHFKTVAQWRAVFSQLDLSISYECWLSRGLHQQRLFVLETGSR